MMTIDDFYVDKAKESLIEAYKERIYQAFHVNITLCHDEDDKLSTKICMSSSDENGTSKNVKKAKTYVESLTADEETLSRCIQTLPTSHFTMVQELQSTIERDSQAVVDLSKENFNVCIFGKKENVGIAQALIDQLVKKEGGIEPYIDIHLHERDKGHAGTKFQEGSELICRNEEQDNVDSLNENGNVTCEDDRENSDVSRVKLHGSESMNKVSNVTGSTEKKQIRGHSALKRTVSVGMSPLPAELTAPRKSPLTKTMSYGHSVKVIENSLSNLKLKHQSSTSSEEETTDEEEYNTKIEFALKLGYSELQLASVLKKLGNKAGQNEILSELIKLSTSSDKESKSSEEGSPSLCALEGSSENLLAFTSENCFDLSDSTSNFRPIVIDGSNVAMSHGNKEIFSCRGIQLAVDWFRDRGHKAITVFVPQWRKETSRVDAKITDQDILFQLEKEKVLVFTPARRIGGKRVVCYDDRYILNLAADSGGVVVSNDNYRDLVTEKSEYRKVVEERLLMYSFVNDRFMPPDDPLGRHGPSLDNFLCKEPRQPEPLPPICPYGSRKCTYGNKCKFYHPERGNMPHKMVTEKLAEQAKQKIQEVRENRKTQEGSKGKQPLCKKSSRGKTALTRTQSLTPKPLPDSLVADTPTKRLSGDFGEAAMDVLPRNVEYRDVESEEKWRSYNDKLSEYRKQVEQADKEQQRQRSETIESQLSAKMQNVEPFNRASKMEHCGSRSSSPRQRSTPSPQPMPPQEMFLSGHLMLAKKLSDEAGETKSHKSEERLLNRSPPSHYACSSPLSTPVKQNKPLTQHPTRMLNQQLPPHHQPLSQQFSHPVPMQQHQHQSLSRQYSLQGSQDPRLQQEHMFSAHSSRERLPQDNFGGFGIPKNAFAGENFTNLPPHLSGRPDHRYLGEESEHAALARMQSAPETIFTRQDNNSHKRFGRMVRQNSSSDTQLHMIGDVDLGSSEYSLFPSESVDFNRGNPPSSQYSCGMNPQRMDPRHFRSRAVGSFPKQEYRSQHGNGETRWTFEPVLGLGHSGYGNHYTANQGIDAFESDYPSAPTWQSQENMKYSVEGYRYPQPSFDPFHESSGLPFSQHRPVERCHSGGFSFQNQTPSNMCAMSNFCENQQHSMLQNPSGKQSVGIIGEEHKQSLSRTSSANLCGHPSGRQSFGATMNPIGMSVMEGSGSRPKFSEFAPVEPTDKRYNLYFHLCGLFPEPKVRKVMSDHPEETSPQELCALIISMK